jgi:hypothetical protein
MERRFEENPTSISTSRLFQIKFERISAVGILGNVKWLKTVAVFVLLAGWLAASNHCRLELIPGLSFMACCEQGDGVPAQDRDCENDGCATVEGSFYKMEDGQPPVSAPPLAALTLLLPLLSVQVSPTPASHVTPDSLPPELQVRWQFSFRAAAPPRAPSLVS